MRHAQGTPNGLAGVVQNGPILGASSGAGSRRWFCRGFWGSETTCSPELLVGEHVVKCRFTHTRTPPSDRPPDPQPHWRYLHLNHAEFAKLPPIRSPRATFATAILAPSALGFCATASRKRERAES